MNYIVITDSPNGLIAERIEAASPNVALTKMGLRHPAANVRRNCILTNDGDIIAGNAEYAPHAGRLLQKETTQ